MKTKRNIIIVSILAALVLAGAGALIWKTTHKEQDFSGTAGVSKVNYDPPTEAEQQAGNEQKQAVVDQTKLDQDNTSNSTATVFISDAAYYADSNAVEIRAYVSNVFEDGGTCTAILTNGSQTVTQSHAAFKDSTTTQCGALDIPRGQFNTAGTWKLTVAYKSATASGQATGEVKL